MSVKSIFFLTALLAFVQMALPVQAQNKENEVTLRLYQGATAYIANPGGVKFKVSLDVREWNMLENGPRELLVKIYDPDGKVLVRKLVEDDGITGDALMPEAGGWDHEMWYYTLMYGRGTVPMLRWSSFTDPERLAALQKRTFDFRVGGKKGIYRVLLAGSRDHVATLRVSNGLKYGLAGHPNWIHGHGDMLKRSYVYVPKGTVGINLGFAEYDQPVTRTFTVTAPDGAVLWQGPARGGFGDRTVKLDPPGKYDDQLLTVDVSDGQGDYMMFIQLSRTDVHNYRGLPGVPAIYCRNEATAKALQGGAIYHDGLVFWHGFQVRMHDWMKKNLKEEDFIVRDADGKEIKPTEGPKFGWGKPSLVYKGLPVRPGFTPLNGVHEAPPLCDTLMYSYPEHKNRAVLNVAIRDLAEGLRGITVGDTPVISGWNGNLGYVFGTYGFHYWRPAWRIIQQSDAPPEVKAIFTDAINLCGDRLSMAAGLERTNGNAMSHIPMALRYAAEATKDPFLTKLADTYFERFVSGGWGRGSGISKSGDCQEHFAHDFAYGTYINANYTAVVNDLGDERFAAVLSRLRELYSYLYCADANAFPWGSRTAQGAGLGKSNWKGDPGPSFTVSVNDGDEWFAARRPTYYALTFQGRLVPEWLNNYYATRIGYGGGVLCQLTVPGFGTVLASTLNDSYGGGMQRENWANFHINSIVGTMANGKPLVAADSEHLNAKLNGTTVTGSGEVRDRPVRSTRSYTFNDDAIVCSTSLSDTDYREAYWGHGEAAVVTEAYEMIPFVNANPKVKNAVQTKVQVITDEGAPGDMLTAQLTAARGVSVDRGGYGVKILFDRTRPVKLGNKNTILVQLADSRTEAAKIAIDYTLVPYIGTPDNAATGKKEPSKLANLPGLTTPEAVTVALADQQTYMVKNGANSLAEVRFAVAGDALAVLATVTDAKITRAATVWQGSCIEVFGAMPDSAKLGQVFLAPTVGDKPAAGFKAGKTIEPAPQIRVISAPTPTGYTLSALIPLSLLTIDPATKALRLECQVSAGVAKGPMVHGTLFGSQRAYENNFLYGDFVVEK